MQFYLQFLLSWALLVIIGIVPEGEFFLEFFVLIVFDFVKFEVAEFCV